jgi:hypothetical protein
LQVDGQLHRSHRVVRMLKLRYPKGADEDTPFVIDDKLHGDRGGGGKAGEGRVWGEGGEGGRGGGERGRESRGWMMCCVVVISVSLTLEP